MSKTFITIDGSQGEGGGQILRSSLALSMVTGRAFRITKIRAGRAKPGLMRQHLTCVQAAAAISSAQVAGDAVGSQELTFSPDSVRPGNYHFAVGTAGGTSLVLQAVLPALLRASEPSTITVEGGTHNRHAPTFEFLERTLIPVINRSGAAVCARIERLGFYPAGGGRVVVGVQPTGNPTPIDLLERGQRKRVHATAIISRLSNDIARREIGVLRDRLALEDHQTSVNDAHDSAGPGNAVMVELNYEHITETFSNIGEIGKSAEVVARELADRVRDYIATQKPVGLFLADQLMVPLALLAGGQYATGPLTEHARTNISTIKAFGGEVLVDHENTVSVKGMLA